MKTLANLIQEVIETMADAGAFAAMSYAPPESGLPLVQAKLLEALELARHHVTPETADQAGQSRLH